MAKAKKKAKPKKTKKTKPTKKAPAKKFKRKGIKRKFPPRIPKAVLAPFNRKMSKTGRIVIEAIHSHVGTKTFKYLMSEIEGLHASLSKKEFIEAITSSGLSDHEAYTLWHSPPMG